MIQKRLARVNVAIFALINGGRWYWVCLTGVVILDRDGQGDGNSNGNSNGDSNCRIISIGTVLWENSCLQIAVAVFLKHFGCSA